MTIKRGTSFTGIERARGLPTNPIYYVQVDYAASDQGYVFEKLVHLDAADGTSAATSNTGHNHTENGQLIFKPFLTQAFGGTGGQTTEVFDTNAIEQRPYTIAPTDSTTTTASTRLLSMIFFVPAGFTNRNIVFALDSDGTVPRCQAALYNSSLTLLTGGVGFTTLVPLHTVSSMFAASGATSHYGFIFQVSSAGAYVIDMYASVQAGPPLGFKILSCMVCPELDPNNVYLPPAAPDLGASNVITVGDPDSSNAWHPIDSNLVDVDNPLGAALILLEHNNALLYERATGNPVPGNATITGTGHTHSGASGAGREIEQAIGAWCFGGSFLSTFTEVYGINARAMIPDNNNVAREVFRTRVYLPVSSGTANLKCWVLVGGETSKCGTIEVVVSVGGVSQTFTTTGGTSTDPAWLVVLGGTAFSSYTSNAVNDVVVTLRLTVDTASPSAEGYPRLFGFALGIDP